LYKETLQAEVLGARSVLDKTRGAYLLSDDPLPPAVFLEPPTIVPVIPIPWASPPRHKRMDYLSREQLLDEITALHQKLDIATTQNQHLQSALDAANIQMTVQHLHVRRLEKSRTPDARPARYTFFPGGKGLELTSEPVLVSIRERNDAVEQERLAKEARKKVSAEKQANAASLMSQKNAATAAWEREKLRAAEAEALWRHNGSQRGCKPVRRLMKDVMAPYLAGEVVIEEPIPALATEEELEEIFDLEGVVDSGSGESEGPLGSDDDDYCP